MKSYSQIGQDLYYIENISKYKTGGIFLDIGANDGIFTSNTYNLEKEYGWHGICIEANPTLIDSLKNNRPNSKIVNKGVWSSPGELEFEIPLTDKKNTQGNLLSRIKGLDLNKGYWEDHFNDAVQTITIQTDTITNIIEKFYPFPATVDYMSLDIEGAELEALKGINFDKINIKFMTIEHGNRKNYLEEIVKYLKNFGYSIHRINKWDVEFIK
jgi:FkbM family methyltransferase